jgi:hypothetical protein
MFNLFAKKRTVEFQSTKANLHNYRFIGEEMEALGSRLDAARKSLAQARSVWARWYWQETVNRLLTQWRALPILRDGDAQITLIPRWTVDYHFYEHAEELASWDISEKIFNKICQPNLDESWNRIRTERIMRCNCQ